MKSAPIDFSPLAKMRQLQVDGREIDFSQSLPKQIKSIRPRDYLLMFLLVILAIVLMALIGAAGLLIFIIPSVYYGSKLGNQEEKTWRSFAALNGWQILPSAPVYPPSILDEGHSHQSSEVISGTYNGSKLYTYECQYTVGEGRDSHTYKFTVVALGLPPGLPHLMVRPHQTINTPHGLSEKLQLEGDFNKYFQIFTEPHKEVEGRVVLTPDVMDLMINEGKKYTVETDATGVYVYAANDLRTIKDLPPLMTYAFKAYEQVKQNLPLAQMGAAPAP
jgi:hypothetical protein